MEGEEGDRSESGIEMRSMIRMLMEEQMRVEAERAEGRRLEEERREEVAREARRLEEERKERAAQAAADRLFEQQEALSVKQYEQQVALMRMQAEIGEKAASAHRREQEVTRKRDRAISSIPCYRDGEDVEEFLVTAERRLSAGEIPDREWLTTIASKLSGKVGSVWQDLCVVSEDYQEVRNRLLKSCGYTAKLAGDLWFGFKADQVKGLTADQLYHKGVQLLRRLLSPSKVGVEAEFALVRAWMGFIIPKRARAALDSRSVSTAAELIDAVQDYLIMEGDRTEGQAAVFGRQAHGSESGSDRKVSGGNCFTCGKPGHKASDCWQGKSSLSGSDAAQPAVASGGTPSKINCYACGEEGHKSNQCPGRGKNAKAEPKPVETQQLRRIWRYPSTDVMLSGKVNNQKVSVLLDSGASISVVPDSMVAKNQLTGDMVAVKAFGVKKSSWLNTADITFQIGSLEWVEHVAVAPWEEGACNEVIYSLSLRSKRGLDLVLLANKVEQPDVKLGRAEMKSSGESTGEVKPVADRPAGGSDPGASELAIGVRRIDEEILVEVEEVEEAVSLADEQCTYVESSGAGKVDLKITSVLKELSDTARWMATRETGKSGGGKTQVLHTEERPYVREREVRRLKVILMIWKVIRRKAEGKVENWLSLLLILVWSDGWKQDWRPLITHGYVLVICVLMWCLL